MFVGHYAPAVVVAAHPKAPPAWLLFVAVQFVDYLFFLAVFPGWERAPFDPAAPSALPFALDAPWTHSLLGSAGLAMLFGAGAALAAPAGRKLAWGVMAGLVVLSHWALDWLVHRPDLPLVPGAEPLGLGLWYRPWIAWPLEIGLLAAATWVFARAVPSRARAAWALTAFMVAVQLISRTLLPPATEITDMAPSALIAYTLFAALAAWALRKPKTVEAYTPSPRTCPPS
ncbi:MAG: hypothetical protein ACK5SX_01240 [Sandaracinobacter sp.]